MSALYLESVVISECVAAEVLENEAPSETAWLNIEVTQKKKKKEKGPIKYIKGK